MGTRSATETIVGILVAFFEQKTWQQAELSVKLDIGTRALRQRLEELRDSGKIPLVREEDLPHVYWSVPASWVPGGVVLTGEEAVQMLRLIARLPQSPERDRVLKRFTVSVGEVTAANVTLLRGNEQVLRTIEEAAAQRVALRFDYFSASRGDHRVRVASVHKLRGGDHWRFVATCHDRMRLCWFRVDSVLTASPASDSPFLVAEEAELNQFLLTSIDGFSGSDAPLNCWFIARYPEARWVRNNLPEEEHFCSSEADGGIRFACRTTAVELIARFVVGLGCLVTDASPELCVKATELARETLESLNPHMHPRHTR